MERSSTHVNGLFPSEHSGRGRSSSNFTMKRSNSQGGGLAANLNGTSELTNNLQTVGGGNQFDSLRRFELENNEELQSVMDEISAKSVEAFQLVTLKDNDSGDAMNTITDLRTLQVRLKQNLSIHLEIAEEIPRSVHINAWLQAVGDAIQSFCITATEMSSANTKDHVLNLQKLGSYTKVLKKSMSSLMEAPIQNSSVSEAAFSRGVENLEQVLKEVTEMKKSGDISRFIGLLLRRQETLNFGATELCTHIYLWPLRAGIRRIIRFHLVNIEQIISFCFAKELKKAKQKAKEVLGVLTKLWRCLDAAKLDNYVVQNFMNGLSSVETVSEAIPVIRVNKKLLHKFIAGEDIGDFRKKKSIQRRPSSVYITDLMMPPNSPPPGTPRNFSLFAPPPTTPPNFSPPSSSPPDGLDFTPEPPKEEDGTSYFDEDLGAEISLRATPLMGESLDIKEDPEADVRFSSFVDAFKNSIDTVKGFLIAIASNDVATRLESLIEESVDQAKEMIRWANGMLLYSDYNPFVIRKIELGSESVRQSYLQFIVSIKRLLLEVKHTYHKEDAIVTLDFGDYLSTYAACDLLLRDLCEFHSVALLATTESEYLGTHELFVKNKNDVWNMNTPLWEDNIEDGVNLKKYKDIHLETAGGSEPDPERYAVGTLNSLIRIITSPQAVDKNFEDSILMGFKTFVSPILFGRKLMERYHVPEGAVSKVDKGAIELRVLNTLKFWTAHGMSDFCPIVQNKPLIEEMTTFLDQMAEHQRISERIKNTLMKYSEKGEEPPTKITFNIFSDLEIHARISVYRMFFDYDISVIAQQLCIHDFELFSKIDNSEFLNVSWKSDDSKHLAPNILATIDRFNCISAWLVTCVLLQSTVKNRGFILGKLVELAQLCLDMNNFSSLLAILSVFSNSAISRLTHSFNLLGKKGNDKIKQLTEVMSPSDSYKVYRGYLTSKPPPLVPYLGVSLQDLTFIDEGNPRLVDELINFGRCEMEFGVSTTLEMFKSTPYDYGKLQPAFDLLHRPPGIKDPKALFNISLTREPRKAQVGVIL